MAYLKVKGNHYACILVHYYWISNMIYILACQSYEGDLSTSFNILGDVQDCGTTIQFVAFDF
jgi:hypothetical protein